MSNGDTTRLQKAITLPGQRIPGFFTHVVTLSKPVYAMPAPSGSMAGKSGLTLDASDMQRFQLWMTARESGALIGTEKLNASPALLAAMNDFENYLASPTYANWAMVDGVSRDAQYRLFCIDVATAVDGKATLPVSGDPLGQGANPIAPSDVGVIGGEPTFPPGEPVVTGDPVTPDTVYGDDGSVVTVS